MPDRKDSYDFDFDPKLLERFLFLFNIARRHALTYPAEHPLVIKAIQNFLVLLDELLEFSDHITFGIARDNLLIGDQALKKNPIFQDLANSLFNCEILSLTIRLSISHEELISFFKLMREEPEQVRGCGGVNYQLQLRGVRGIEVQELDFAPLQTIELARVEVDTGPGGWQGDGELPWQSFVKGVMAGTIESGEGGYVASDRVDPAELARLLNEQEIGGGVDTSYEAAITSFLQQVNQEAVVSDARRDSLGSLGRMADKLAPELRLRLIHSSFINLADRADLAEAVVADLAPETLAEILEGIAEEKLQIPPGLFDMLCKLAEHRQVDGAERVIQSHAPGDRELEGRIRALFRSSNPGQFIPEDYQQLLKELLAVEPVDNLPEDLGLELGRSLEGFAIESEVLAIILEIIDAEPLSEHAELLQENLIDLVRFFLEVGDFQALAKTYRRLQQHRHESDAFSVPIALETLAVCETDEFVTEVMAGIDNWERDKLEGLGEMLATIGTPFVKPLLERLAEEEDMALRQFLLATLLRIGEPAKQEALRQLHDSRWYLVRNLIILLRRFNDPAVMPAVRRLVGHKHPKVHLEVLKTFLHYKDPRIDHYLLRELGSSDRERRRNAIFLARNSKDTDVHRELLKQLGEGRGEADYDLREQAVKSLAEIGNPRFWPILLEQLQSRNLLHKRRHRQYRLLILTSLRLYPRQALRRWLEEFCRVGRERELLDFAQQMLAGLPEEEA